jgi:hypothetical protein
MVSQRKVKLQRRNIKHPLFKNVDVLNATKLLESRDVRASGQGRALTGPPVVVIPSERSL